MTNISEQTDNALIMFSLIPSPMYSCAGSPLMFVNDRTAMEGLSGNGNAILSTVALLALWAVASDTGRTR